MTIQRQIDWKKLAEIRELKEFFEADFQGFKAEIETQIHDFSQFPEDSLDKFAKLRALEVTNGITQWAYRRGDENALSIEKTRECMNLVMGFMKKIELYFPSEGMIEFNEAEKNLINTGRSLYKDAFKNNVAGKEREYHGASTAQFIVYGHDRVEAAIALVEKDYSDLFSSYYIERMKKYIGAYLDGFSEMPI